jgi:hypothetical protein
MELGDSTDVLSRNHRNTFKIRRMQKGILIFVRTAGKQIRNLSWDHTTHLSFFIKQGFLNNITQHPLALHKNLIVLVNHWYAMLFLFSMNDNSATYFDPHYLMVTS